MELKHSSDLQQFGSHFVASAAGIIAHNYAVSNKLIAAVRKHGYIALTVKNKCGAVNTFRQVVIKPTNDLTRLYLFGRETKLVHS